MSLVMTSSSIDHLSSQDPSKTVQGQLEKSFQEILQLLETPGLDKSMIPFIRNRVSDFANMISTLSRVQDIDAITDSQQNKSRETSPLVSSTAQFKTINRAQKRPHSAIEDDAESSTSMTSRESDEDLSTADIPIQTKKRQREADSINSTIVRPVTVAISSECGVVQLTRIRDDFLSQVSELRNDKRGDQTAFKGEDAVDVTNFFFDEVIGPTCLNRLAQFVDAYGHRDSYDPGLAKRMANIALDKTAPLSVQDFFGIFSRHQEVHSVKNKVLGRLEQTIQERALYIKWKGLCQDLDRRDPDLIKYLESHGFKTIKGKTYRAVATDFLAKLVGVPHNSFTHACEKAKGVNGLVEHFGEGIIPLLPPGAVTRLRRFGNHRMLEVYKLLHEMVPALQFICDLVKQHFYDPYMRGDRHLAIASPGVAQSSYESNTLTDVIQRAIANGRVIEEEDDSDEHNNENHIRIEG